jgi:hypothetical protein
VSEPPRNPYAPPKAPLHDAPNAVAERPPRPIVLAMRLLWGSLALSVVTLAMDWQEFGAGMPLELVVCIVAGTYAISGVLYWKVGAGANWARIVVLVLVALAMAMTFPDLPEIAQRAPLVAGLDLICRFAEVFAMYLAFVPGRDWFRKQG